MSFKDVLGILSSKAGDGIKSSKGFEGKHLISPADAFRNSLQLTSGTSFNKTSTGIIYQIVAFRGVSDGNGASLLLANSALALAEKGLKVCVVDTSILRPVQDLYLATGVRNKNPKEVLDWFDMPLTKQSVLGVSSLNSNINVLCFTNRSIVDALSSSDTEELVTVAFKQLESRYDIILVDVSNESTVISTTAMNKSHTVFQVWSNDVPTLNTIPSFIKNVTTLACTVDKLRYVITSKVIKDIKTDWDSILGHYGFKHLASTPDSADVARISASGKLMWGYPSNTDGVRAYNDAVATICNRILGVDIKLKEQSTVSIEDIQAGEVEGTTHYKLAHPPEEVLDFRDTVAKNTEQALGEMELASEDFDIFDTQPTNNQPVISKDKQVVKTIENSSKLGKFFNLLFK